MKKQVAILMCLLCAMSFMTACQKSSQEISGAEGKAFVEKQEKMMNEMLKNMAPGTTLEDVKKSQLYSWKGSDYFHAYDCPDLIKAVEDGKNVRPGDQMMIKMSGKKPCPKCLPDYDESAQQ